MNKKEKDQHSIYIYLSIYPHIQIQYKTNYLDSKPCASSLHMWQEFKNGMDDPGQIHIHSEEWLKSYTRPGKFIHLPIGCSFVL